jgi:hypothetical protein
MSEQRSMRNPRKCLTIGLRIPTEEEILENPRRANFMGGGWIDSLDSNTINLYWHKRQHHFTIYSILQVLEHETLHVVLAVIFDLETSMKLDSIHRCSCIKLTEDRLVFVNEIRINRWQSAPYMEEPTQDLLDHEQVPRHTRTVG